MKYIIESVGAQVNLKVIRDDGAEIPLVLSDAGLTIDTRLVEIAPEADGTLHVTILFAVPETP